MRRIGKFLKAIFKLFAIYAIIVVVVSAFLFFFPDVWSPPLLREIEKFSQSRFGVTLQADRLRWVGISPMVWRIENPRFIMPGNHAQGTAQAIELKFKGSRVDNNWARPKLEVGISLLAPKLELLLGGGAQKGGEKAAGPANPSAGLPLVRPQGIDFSFSLEIINGEVAIKFGESEAPYKLEKVSLKATLPTMRSEVWRPTLVFKSQLAMQVKSIAVSQPLALDLPEIELGTEKVKIQKGVLRAAELPFTLDGYYYFTSSAMKWDLNLPVTDVAKVPVSFLPPGDWKGSFSGALAAERGENPPLNVSGHIDTQGLQGNLSWKSDSTQVEGPVAAQGSLRFAYGDKLRLDNFSFALDLKRALIESKPYFKKSPGTDMFVEVVADGDGESIALRRSSLLLGHLKVLGSGNMDLREGGLVQASFAWPTTDLGGMEKIFLPLSQAPLRGQVAGDLDIKGPWQKPALIAVDLKSLKLENMFGKLDWTSSSGMRIAGPVAASGNVQAFLQGSQLKRASAAAALDLSFIEVSGHTMIRKPAALALKAQFDVNYDPQKIALKYLKLAGTSGDINLSGTAKFEGQKAPLNFRLILAKARVENWMKLLVKPPVDLSGEMSGAVDLKGVYNYEEKIQASPLRAVGHLDLSKAIMVYKSPKLARSVEKKIEVPEPPPEPLLPSWPIVRNSDVVFQVGFTKVFYDDLEMGNVSSRMKLHSGQLAGSAAIGSIWGGSVATQKIIISPLVAPPGIETVLSAQAIQAGSMLGWFSPSLKGYMKGLISGSTAIIGPIPRGANGLKSIKADGEVHVVSGQFLTWELESKINDKLKKVGLGKNKLNAKDVLFTADSKFALNDGSAKVNQLDLTTSDRDEIKLRGTVNLDMTMDLAGTAFVASQKVSGAIAEANTDASGRLAVPLQVRGSVMDPEFLFAEATLKKMLSNAAEQEAKRALSQAGDKVKEDLKKDVKKKLKGLFGK